MKANILFIEPIDASDTSTEVHIKYRWSGTVSRYNRCIIKTNDSAQTVVYDKTEETFHMYHTLDKSDASYKLKNGNNYAVYVLVSTDGQTWSEMQSTSALMMCLTTPAFKFTTLPSTVPSTNYTFTLNYSQKEGELLQYYNVEIYDNADVLLKKTGTVYVSADNQTGFQVSYAGFKNNHSYYIIAHGTTVNQMTMTTGKVAFVVQYNQPTIFSFLDVENEPDVGGINIKSNYKIITGRAYDSDDNEVKPTLFTVSDDNKAVKLFQNNNTLKYTDNVKFVDTWSYVAIMNNIDSNKPLITFTSTDHSHALTLYKREGKNGTNDYGFYFELIEDIDLGNDAHVHKIYADNSHHSGKAWKDYDKTYQELIDYTWNQLASGTLYDDDWYIVHIYCKDGLYAVESKLRKDGE